MINAESAFLDIPVNSGSVNLREITGSDFDFLRLKESPRRKTSHGTIRVVDLFCGAGGLSLGLNLAIEALGFDSDTRLALDTDGAAITCYQRNFPKARVFQGSIERYFSSRLDAPLTEEEKKLQEQVGHVDILAGGPPCQGHSDLNNFTRRNDPKNLLYLYMARAAIVLKPQAVLIENVPGSLHDKNGVVQTVVSILTAEGFHVHCDSVDFLEIGVPQKRRRLVITACKKPQSTITDVQREFSVSRRNVEWAIRDLEHDQCEALTSQSSKPKPITQQRIDFLFQHGLYELPNSERPPCHRNKNHSYDTVYGRLRWDLPAQTITSGFYCMCMGRYVHPSMPRTLTAHEAARLQFFPDFFDFNPAGSRTRIARLIGNAVPPKASYVLGLDLVRALKADRKFAVNR